MANLINYSISSKINTAYTQKYSIRALLPALLILFSCVMSQPAHAHASSSRRLPHTPNTIIRTQRNQNTVPVSTLTTTRASKNKQITHKSLKSRLSKWTSKKWDQTCQAIRNVNKVAAGAATLVVMAGGVLLAANMRSADGDKLGYAPNLGDQPNVGLIPGLGGLGGLGQPGGDGDGAGNQGEDKEWRALGTQDRKTMGWNRALSFNLVNKKDSEEARSNGYASYSWIARCAEQNSVHEMDRVVDELVDARTRSVWEHAHDLNLVDQEECPGYWYIAANQRKYLWFWPAFAHPFYGGRQAILEKAARQAQGQAAGEDEDGDDGVFVENDEAEDERKPQSEKERIRRQGRQGDSGQDADEEAGAQFVHGRDPEAEEEERKRVGEVNGCNTPRKGSHDAEQGAEQNDGAEEGGDWEVIRPRRALGQELLNAMDGVGGDDAPETKQRAAAEQEGQEQQVVPSGTLDKAVRKKYLKELRAKGLVYEEFNGDKGKQKNDMLIELWHWSEGLGLRKQLMREWIVSEWKAIMEGPAQLETFQGAHERLLSEIQNRRDKLNRERDLEQAKAQLHEAPDIAPVQKEPQKRKPARVMNACQEKRWEHAVKNHGVNAADKDNAFEINHICNWLVNIRCSNPDNHNTCLALVDNVFILRKKWSQGVEELRKGSDANLLFEGDDCRNHSLVRMLWACQKKGDNVNVWWGWAKQHWAKWKQNIEWSLVDFARHEAGLVAYIEKNHAPPSKKNKNATPPAAPDSNHKPAPKQDPLDILNQEGIANRVLQQPGSAAAKEPERKEEAAEEEVQGHVMSLGMNGRQAVSDDGFKLNPCQTAKWQEVVFVLNKWDFRSGPRNQSDLAAEKFKWLACDCIDKDGQHSACKEEVAQYFNLHGKSRNKGVAVNRAEPIVQEVRPSHENGDGNGAKKQETAVGVDEKEEAEAENIDATQQILLNDNQLAAWNQAVKEGYMPNKTLNYETLQEQMHWLEKVAKVGNEDDRAVIISEQLGGNVRMRARIITYSHENEEFKKVVNLTPVYERQGCDLARLWLMSSNKKHKELIRKDILQKWQELSDRPAAEQEFKAAYDAFVSQIKEMELVASAQAL